MQDWKDKLSAAFGDYQPQPETEPAPEPTDDPVKQQANQPVHIIYERKGRAGKQATIIVDWRVDDDTLKQIAATLKKTLGVGGSARDGEILLQGDRRQQAKDLLTQMGFKVKGG